MSQDQWETLVDELLDGVISEADFLRLEAQMRVDPELRRRYYARLKLENGLRVEAERLGDSRAEPVIPFWRKHAIGLSAVASVALLIAIGVSGWKFGQVTGQDSVLNVEPSAAGFAVLSDYSEAEWDDGVRLDRGDLLPGGALRLNSGVAQLELFSGVTVILEGESEFELHSPMEMTVTKGRIRALVPPAAKGFKVNTATGEVVDLGTEFALDVTSERAEMHVIEGEIEWHPNASDVRSLTDGQSLSWTFEGEFTATGFSSNTFPRLEDFERKFLGQRQARKEAWESASETMAGDSRLIAYFPMNLEDASSRQLVDGSGSGFHGTIVSARKAADRWDESGRALSFSPAGSRVRVSVPGVHRSMTFYCWARIDSLDRMYNSLFLTDGHDLHEPHWQIMSDGRLFFSVKKRESWPKDPDKHITYSASFWDPSMSGKWFQIATVYDVDAQTTTHYVNGKAIGRDRISDEFVVDTVRVGAASIGNWNEPTRNDPTFSLRNLNGAIDEFAIFGDALSGEEIAELYEKGRP